ncbi:FKBP-type peptidyl-prolyl cis-trans isomerase FkpA [Thalassocella blandensis]|nr:FKBP-type peptidyl-prolyl cis-trans isomerase FkpA [Thalassocella blandensis]
MKTLKITKIGLMISAGLLLTACNQDAEKTSSKPVNLDDEKVQLAYAIGAGGGNAMARNLETLDGTDYVVDKEVIIKAFADGVRGESQLDEQTIQKVMNDFRTNLGKVMQEKRKKEAEEQAKLAEKNVEIGKKYLEENKAKDGVVTLESGLQYKIVEEGKGASPKSTDKVKVHYKGTLIDGTQFDSSYDRGQPAVFGVTQVIKGWTEALQLMKEGAKWQLFIPADLAYGPSPRPNIPGNSVLVFDVELLEIVKPQPKASVTPPPAKPAEKDVQKKPEATK